ncbi:MAG TPA: hypothetical protein VG498_02315, partial [Terriglobales bacterium]|nr:hypothetical protein [Terriglobales bacterium]
ENDALAISQNIQSLHVPYGTILDPRFASADPNSPSYNTVASYTRCRDSAIWSGHYLAAESFRFQVTESSDAFGNLQRALKGIRSLREVTGTDVLARCLFPTNSQYAAGLIAENQDLGVYQGTVSGQSYYWIGNTSRDQYSGVLFGLGVSYDMVNDDSLRSTISSEVTRLVNNLIANAWAVVMPNGSISTSFLGHPEQILSFLQVGRHVNPAQFQSTYEAYRAALSPYVALPILYDCFDDHNHYFKFNLDSINLYNLIRLEEPSSAFLRSYLAAYTVLRNTTRTHQNAHFNMIDRGIHGADPVRDEETVLLLNQWLQRGRRDSWVDLSSQYPACGQADRSCVIIPVPQRPNTDFLWQRSPRLLYGGGEGTVETAAIDYILSYWMARYYEVNGVN